MIRFLRRLLLFLFLESAALLTLFYIPETWYGHWTLAYLAWTLLALIISWRSIPSRKIDNLITKTAEEWKVIQGMEEEVRSQARQMEMICPACEVKASYWSFLDNFKCRSCGSDLFGSAVAKMEEPWRELLHKREKIMTFHERTPPWLLRRGKARAL